MAFTANEVHNMKSKAATSLEIHRVILINAAGTLTPINQTPSSSSNQKHCNEEVV
jgi:hypothetical protein